MDGLARLERHQHEQRNDHQDDREPQIADSGALLPSQGHDYRPVEVGGAADGAASLSGAPVVGLIVNPLCASKSRSLSSLLLTAAAARLRISVSLMRPSWML